MDDLQITAPGTMVYGEDEENVGTVESSDEMIVVVDTGDIPPVLYIPLDAIFETREDGIYLTVSRDEALANPDWIREPVPDEHEGRLQGESDYSAIEAEDSLNPDFDIMPVEDVPSKTKTIHQPAPVEGNMERPSGETGPETEDGNV